MGLERREQRIDPLEQALVDDALVLVGLDLVLALESGLVDLVLLGSDEGALVDVGVDFDVRVVAELLLISAINRYCSDDVHDVQETPTSASHLL